MTRSWLDSPRKRLVAAVLSGFLISIAESLHPWWPVTWIAPVPLLAAAFIGSRREATMLAALAALVGCASTTPYYFEVAGPIVALLLPIGRALSLAIIVIATRLAVVRWRHWLSIVVYPGLMAGSDTLVALFSRHGTAGSLAYSQMNAVPIVQTAAVAGASGIVFVVSLFASTIAIAWYHQGNLRRFRIGYGFAAVLLLASIAFGFARIAAAKVGPGIPVGLVAIDTPPFVSATTPDAPLWAVYREAINTAAQMGAAAVVMPEKITALTPAQAADVAQSLAHTAENDKIYVLAGITIVESGHKENRAWLFDPAGHLEADYAKRHLVPGFEDSFIPGGRIVVRIIEGSLTGIAICKDMDFSRLGRDYAEQGVTMMLVPAWDFHHDGWLHSRMAVLRGVEGGFSVARTARDGLLTISDRYGRVLHQASSSKRPYAILVGSVPAGSAQETVYTRIGNVFGWAVLTFAVLVIIRAAVTVSLWSWLRAGSR